MIKDWVARAMQIVCIEDEIIIKRLHATEVRLKHALPNWNIQEILRIPTIKEHHGIPADDLEAQERHQERIEKELKECKLEFVYYPEMDSLECLHSMDWKVFKNKNQVNWYYVGGPKKKGNILRQFKEETD